MSRRAPAARVVWTALGDATARSDYARLLAASPQRTPFHTLAHADAACDAFGLSAELLLVLADDQLVVGGIVFWRRRGPFHLAVVPPLTPYGGPVCEADLDDALAGSEPLGADGGALSLWIEALSERADAAEFHLPPAVADARPFAWAGWRLSTRYTYRGASDWGGSVPAYVRQMVRENRAVRADGSARPSGLTVHRDNGSAEHVGEFAERPFRRRGEPVAVSAAATAALVNAHVAAGLARVSAVVSQDGTPVGATATTADDRAGYFWAGSADPGAGMLMLMADAADALHADGVPALDLVGANLRGVSAFKRRLGFPLVAHTRAEIATSKLLRAREALRR